MTFHLLKDADTARLLPALGLNPFIEGEGMATFHVRKEILDGTDFGAFSPTDLAERQKMIQGMLALQTAERSELANLTPETYWAEILAVTGAGVHEAKIGLSAREIVADNLEVLREEVSGVNLAEEISRLVEFQQALQAVASVLSRSFDLEQQAMELLG